MEAKENQVPLPLRSHTILGVCEALGEDFGFNPLWLRVPIGASVIFSPMGALGVYFALGFVVLLSRLLAPKRKAAPAPEAIEQPATAIVEDRQQEFKQAA